MTGDGQTLGLRVRKCRRISVKKLKTLANCLEHSRSAANRVVIVVTGHSRGKSERNRPFWRLVAMQQEAPMMGSRALGINETKSPDTPEHRPTVLTQKEWLKEIDLGDAERLRHIQKMEVVGKFAGGIAHDLNNILTVIVGSSQLLLDHPEVGQAAGPRVQQILDAGFRAANLTSQLLSFSRKQTPRPVTLNLNRIIADSTNMIRFLVGNRIELATLLAADLQNISADPVQMEQILINLCVNARDAMPEGGSIFIE